MTSFTVTGNITGDPVSLTWTDGRIVRDDDTDVVAAAEAEAVARHGLSVAIAGVFDGPAALDEHLAALATVLSLFDAGTATVTGDDPPVEDPPDDTDPDAPEGSGDRLIISN